MNESQIHWSEITLLAQKDDTEALSARGIPLEIKDINARNLLHIFCHFKALRTVSWIVAQYPHLANNKDVIGETPLHRAAYGKGSSPELIESVATPQNINAQTWYGATPLHYAFLEKNQDVLDTILSFGADPNLVDKKGLTAKEWNASDKSQYFQEKKA